MSESTHPADESNDGARIDTTRAAMQQALEALELGRDYAEGERLENERRYRGHEHLAPDDAYALGQIDAAITALRAALAEQDRGSGWCPIHQHYKPCAHNTAAQAQPLTDEDIDILTAESRDALMDHIYEYGTTAEGQQRFIRQIARAVEAEVLKRMGVQR